MLLSARVTIIATVIAKEEEGLLIHSKSLSIQTLGFTITLWCSLKLLL
jgi:hypothetical protein